jgi:penicillin-binding protein 2
MGQGFVLSTPLQVLVSIATLANDGKYMQPTLIREIQDPEGNVIQAFEPKMKWDITKDPVIRVFDENNFATGEMKVVTMGRRTGERGHAPGCSSGWHRRSNI